MSKGGYIRRDRLRAAVRRDNVFVVIVANVLPFSNPNKLSKVIETQAVRDRLVDRNVSASGPWSHTDMPWSCTCVCVCIKTL